jgi:FkbM family methyltransferase
MVKPLRKISELVSFAVAVGAGRLKRHHADIEQLKIAVASLVGAKGHVTTQMGGINNELYAALFSAGAREIEVERLSNLYESLASRIATLEMSVNLKEERPQLDLMEGSVTQQSALLNQVMQEYARVVGERDALLNARDKWLRERQALVRQQTAASESLSSLGVAFPQQLRDLYDPLSVCVVDVGAQNLASEDHVYSPLTRAESAHVIGFEPLRDEANARSAYDPNVLMLNHFVGEGGEGRFRIGKFNPTSSLLEPNQAFLSQFVALPQMCEVVSEAPVNTTRLDDLPEVRDCDFLKIDVQGGELGVLRGATQTLGSTIVVHSEVEFAPIYKDQPFFSDVDIFLRARGFDLIDVVNTGYAAYDDLPRPIASSRLMWADAVYFKSPERLSACGPEKLMRAAYIAHVNYGMYDLAAHYLRHLDEMVGSETRRTYGEKLCEIKLSS